MAWAFVCDVADAFGDDGPIDLILTSPHMGFTSVGPQAAARGKGADKATAVNSAGKPCGNFVKETLVQAKAPNLTRQPGGLPPGTIMPFASKFEYTAGSFFCVVSLIGHRRVLTVDGFNAAIMDRGLHPGLKLKTELATGDERRETELAEAKTAHPGHWAGKGCHPGDVLADVPSVRPADPPLHPSFVRWLRAHKTAALKDLQLAGIIQLVALRPAVVQRIMYHGWSAGKPTRTKIFLSASGDDPKWAAFTSFCLDAFKLVAWGGPGFPKAGDAPHTTGASFAEGCAGIRRLARDREWFPHTTLFGSGEALGTTGGGGSPFPTLAELLQMLCTYPEKANQRSKLQVELLHQTLAHHFPEEDAGVMVQNTTKTKATMRRVAAKLSDKRPGEPLSSDAGAAKVLKRIGDASAADAAADAAAAAASADDA